MASTQVKPTVPLEMGGGHEVEAERKCWKLLRPADIVLRLLAVGLTLVGAVVMGVNKETKTVPLKVVSTLPAMPITIVAKSTYSSASIYFITVNAIACGYTFLSLVLSTVMEKRRELTLALAAADMVMVGLLYSCNGAQAALGVIGLYGNSHLGWHKVCGVFTKFCNIGTAAFAASLLGAIVYLLIVFISALEAYRRS